jgi:hypothetical protein
VIAPPAEPAAAEQPTAPVALAEPPTVPAQEKAADDEAAPQKPKRKRGVLTWVIFSVIVVLVLATVGFLVLRKFNGDPTKNAVVGNCLAGLPAVSVGQDQQVGGARIVDCADSSAVYLVRGRLDGQTAAQAADPTVCQQFNDSRFVYRVFQGSGTGYVLCLHKLDE